MATRLLGRLVALLSFMLVACAFELPGPFMIYKTEPEFLPSLINVTWYTENKDLVEPGYTFIAPHVGSQGYGPQIIDQEGNLIWYGNPTVTHIKGKSVYGMDFYVCDFKGQKMNHLCYSEARPAMLVKDEGIKEGGANRIFDNAYEPVVADFTQVGDLGHPNPHEFNVLPGGESFLQAVYQKRPMDLRPYKGLETGYVWDGCMQEVSMHTRSVIFQWCYLEHHQVHDTYLYLNLPEILELPENERNLSSGTSGKGNKGQPWDFMHLNSLDKNEDGDYLISGRHLSTILKVAGPHSTSGKPPGTTLWRLSGKYSDFHLQREARFARQHHARFVSTGKNETVISLFNNAFNNTETIVDRSNAMILRLNNYTMKATLDSIFKPLEPQLSFAQGSMSVLPGPRNTVQVGWGSFPEWSEYSRDGTLLYHAATWADMSALEEMERKLTNYRSFKFPWVGKPRYPPKMLAYTRNCSSSPVVYISWNGATEVGGWRFYLSKTKLGPRTPAGSFAKTGFETKVRLSTEDFPSTHATWVTAEAIDKNNGLILGEVTSKSFVPSPGIESQCDSEGCYHPTRFNYDMRFTQKCTPTIKPGFEPEEPEPTNAFPGFVDSTGTRLTVLVLIVLAIESWTSLIRRSVLALVHRRPSRRNLFGTANGLTLK